MSRKCVRKESPSEFIRWDGNNDEEIIKFLDTDASFIRIGKGPSNKKIIESAEIFPAVLCEGDYIVKSETAGLSYISFSVYTEADFNNLFEEVMEKD